MGCGDRAQVFHVDVSVDPLIRARPLLMAGRWSKVQAMRQTKNIAAISPALSPQTQPRTHVLEWLTAAEAAQHLKVKTRTLLQWAKQGKVKGYALSGTDRRTWRFLRADLDAGLLANSVSG
jgi:excisionase family DNA binding protein